MKRLLAINLILLCSLSSWAHAAIRDVAAIGQRALRDGRISSTKPLGDFTHINPGAVYDPQLLLVRFAPTANLTAPTRATQNAILATVGGGTIEREYKLVPGLTLVRLPAGQTVNEATLAKFNNPAGILYAEPDYRVTIHRTPNDEYFASQWALEQINDHDIDAPKAWDHATGNSDIIVAVLDTGVDYAHPDLAGNMWVNEAEASGTPGVDDDVPANGYVDDIYGYDFCTYFHTPDSDPCDDYNHGTHCAGIIGAVGNNSEGIAGVCWDVRIMAVKFINAGGYGRASDALNAIEYAVNMGANVLNCSWGYDVGDPLFNVTIQDLTDAFNSAAGANVIAVVSAGNNGRNINTGYFPTYPASCSCANIITVMATDADDERASFSNYGSTAVDLGAPGVDIYSCLAIGGYDYGNMSGTSMAAPHVAGACALLLSIDPSLTYQEVKDLILGTVDSVGLACVSGGRLNVNAAVAELCLADQTPVWKLESPTGVVAWVDASGDLVLSGELWKNRDSFGAGVNGMRIHASGQTIGLLDASTGDMYIHNSCTPNQSPLSPPTGSPFIVKASDGTVLAYMDASGGLYLKGSVFEDVAPL
jgi:subtilisin family serine protease